jgi:hypothetical protein
MTLPVLCGELAATVIRAARAVAVQENLPVDGGAADFSRVYLILHHS